MLRDDAGGIALMLALSLIPLSIAALGALDLQRAISAKSQLQDALDAATLYAARSTATTDADLQALGAPMLRTELDGALGTAGPAATFKAVDGGRTIVGTAQVEVPVMILGLLNADGGSYKDLTVQVASEIKRVANHVEVALALDLTGSMKQSGADADLRIAAANLVDIVVQDVQTPFYSKVALVPYSMAVNVGSYARQVRGDYTAGQTCTTPTCGTFRFPNALNGANNDFHISTCVTERTGVNADTDTAPSITLPATLLGKNYPAPQNDCLTPEILPLSSNKTLLKDTIATYYAQDRSSAGHVGIAWGWYLVSPNFAYLFAGEGKPANYGTEHLIKVVVLMTDGEYNSAYADGVISADSTAGSGNVYDHIARNAPNGHSYVQSQALCAAMKKAGVVVYTVGLKIWDNQSARDLVNKCATDADHVYLPANGQALQDAFKAIAHDIVKLRIAR